MALRLTVRMSRASHPPLCVQVPHTSALQQRNTSTKRLPWPHALTAAVIVPGTLPQEQNFPRSGLPPPRSAQRRWAAQCTGRTPASGLHSARTPASRLRRAPRPRHGRTAPHITAHPTGGGARASSPASQ
eukprot:5219754-Prymnesium_polylepis.2